MIKAPQSLPPRAPTLIQLGQRLLVVIGVTTAVILSIWLWISWEQMRSAQIARMTTTVRLLAAHADHYFASLGGKIEALAEDLQDADWAHRHQTIVQRLAKVRAGNPDILSIAVLTEDGQLLAATGPILRTDGDSLRESVKSLQTPGLRVGRPQRLSFDPQWVLPLRYAMRMPGRQGVFDIVVGIPVLRQQQLWRSLQLPRDAALGLWRDDGYLLSRIPTGPEGKEYRQPTVGGSLNNAVRIQPYSGAYEGTVIDGSYRIGVYQQLATLPVYAFLSHLRSTFVALWWEQVRLSLVLVAGFLLAIFLVYTKLAARYSRRMQTIKAHLTQPGELAAAIPPTSGVHEIDTMVAALAQSHEKLRQSAQNREKLLLAAADAGTYCVRERDGAVLSANETLLKMLDKSEHQVLQRPWNELVTAAGVEAGDDASQEFARRIVRVPSDRNPRWLSLAEYHDTHADGEAVRYGLAIDVSDREHLLEEVNTQSLRLQSLWRLATTRDKSDDQKMQLMLRLALDTLGMNAVILNERRGTVMVVKQLVDDLGLFHVGQMCAVEEALCYQAIEGKQTVVIPDLSADPDFYRHHLTVDKQVRAFASVPIWAGPLLYGTLAFLRRTPMGEDFSTDDRAFMELLAAWFGQIQLEARQHAELEQLAMTDTLTGLINRRAAEVRFVEEFARARRNPSMFSIAVCDLDRFKLVNDHYGHDTGDQALLHVAGVLKEVLREGDWVARWGGEEFIIFLYQSDGAAAYLAMERLRLTIKGHPVSTAHGPLELTASIGIGTFRGIGDLATILSEADGCLFEAKRAGRDRVVMSEPSSRGILWRAGHLQHALVEDRITPAYQVMVNLRTQEVVADETLARLIEPDGRIVEATEFIEAAEGINLIHIVDEVIARKSMQRCTESLKNGTHKPGFTHFINLSPQFLMRRELVLAMLQQAAQCGMHEATQNPMVLEITERQLIGNFEDMLSDLKPLLDFGFRLALDDFGSGYSSFLYLASLPVSFLKIEGWMVRNMHSNAKVLSMVRSTIELARSQGIITIAESVEDAATADLLRDLGADWAQGYYFGLPRCEVEAPMSKALRQAVE